jgi:putative FmdB family regulatory protein
MPLYEYECLKCGARFEQIQKFSDPLVIKHDGCGGKVRKLLSAPAIQFKGSGWYITDYGRAGQTDPDKKAAKTDSDKKTAQKETASESKTSGESKAAAAESTKAATTETSKK